MESIFLFPSSPLRPYINYYLVLDNMSMQDPMLPDPVKVYPSPHPQMAFSYGDSAYEQLLNTPKIPSPDCSVSGYFTKLIEYYPGKKTGVIMVGFQPAAMRSFLPFNIEEITNKNQSLNEIFSPFVFHIQEQLRECKNLNQRIEALERFFLSILRPAEEDFMVSHALNKINRSSGVLRIQTLADFYSLSKKQFERRFHKAIGINPKLFCRIVRFQNIFQHLPDPTKSLAGAAIESGFYDQAHFINEFREFTGQSPAQFLRSNSRTELGEDFDYTLGERDGLGLVYL